MQQGEGLRRRHSGFSLSARLAVPHQRFWCCLGAVGPATPLGQHELRGQDFLLRQQSVSCSGIMNGTQNHKVAPSNLIPGIRLQQSFPHSTLIVYQQPPVHLGGGGAKSEEPAREEGSEVGYRFAVTNRQKLKTE